ncbi:hypothetical protein BDM02DRAFT_3190234 [Thelephora ganbajun]|uniref:Uncharacterized protein n=1 Tax=Thelephora ganbajun TaxID=370292 RepID=A0ACB6Z527_THEGA|nr:hypothetical protein BDM02DRAFT_3190234 [Thelephora ganbajun]
MDLKLPGNRVTKALSGHQEPFKSCDEARKILWRINWNEAALDSVKYSLSRLMRERPVEVYSIVLDLLRAPPQPFPREIARGVEGMARSAARNSLLDPPLGAWTTEVNIRLDDYIRFTTYHLRCGVRLLEFLATEDLIKKTGTEWIWYNTRCGVCPTTAKSIVVPAAALGTAKYPATWWVTYWERVVASVGEFPCEKPFKNERIWDSTLRDLARECPACHKEAAREYPIFRKKLIDLIAEITNGVELEIKL